MVGIILFIAAYVLFLVITKMVVETDWTTTCVFFICLFIIFILWNTGVKKMDKGTGVNSSGQVIQLR